MGGAVALCTLVAMQALVGAVRSTSFGARAVAVKPVLLMAAGRQLDDNMRRCHVTPAELRARLRAAGVGHPDDVAAVVFEPSGMISVLRVGTALSDEFFHDVVGAEHLPR